MEGLRNVYSFFNDLDGQGDMRELTCRDMMILAMEAGTSGEYRAVEVVRRRDTLQKLIPYIGERDLYEFAIVRETFVVELT